MWLLTPNQDGYIYLDCETTRRRGLDSKLTGISFFGDFFHVVNKLMRVQMTAWPEKERSWKISLSAYMGPRAGPASAVPGNTHGRPSLFVAPWKEDANTPDFHIFFEPFLG